MLSQQAGLAPAWDLLGGASGWGLVALLNLQLSPARAQICDIWQGGFSGGTQVDLSKFVPRSRAVWRCPGWTGTPVELSLELSVL